jgi:diguanylate cyclase (GGDEF)-like protein
MGVVLSGISLLDSASSNEQWLAFVVLAVLTTLAHLFKAKGPSHEAWHANLVFLFAGVLLLPPFLFVFLVIVPHLIEWAKERIVNSSSLRAWYIQPFNIATHIIAGLTALWVFNSSEQWAVGSGQWAIDDGRWTMINGLWSIVNGPSSMVVPVLGVMGAALAYVAMNHLLVGLALVLARGISWHASGILRVENLVTDLILLLMGYSFALLWQLNPWLVMPAVAPLVLIYRALMIPQLKKDAQTDDKTGLWNARHFTQLFAVEMERARRFDRPLTLLMADLDLLRNINNTYGHLAGDVVLAGIGRIIRQNIREYDIAGRFGGEEFAIVLPETGPDEAQVLAERLRAAVEAAGFEVKVSSTPIHATMSIGIACLPWDSSTANDLIHEADVAVYQAKLKGRNCVVWASDVPHSVELGTLPEDRMEAPYSVAFVPRAVPVAEHAPGKPTPAAAASATVATLPGHNSAEAAEPLNYPGFLLPLFVGGVIVTAALLAAFGFLFNSQIDLVAIGLLVTLAVVAEILQVDLYGGGTFSVSLAVIFAAALVTGLAGVASVSAAVAVVHFVRRRPALYKTAFNWGTHMLAGLAPVVAVHSLTINLSIGSLLVLAVPVSLAAVAYYAIETGLIATAISLAEGAHPMSTWRERYRWLFSHYFVLCIMGLFLGVAYMAFGPLGLLVFTMPVLMMRYAHRQYIERTQDSVNELKRMNRELTRANREVVVASKAMQHLNEELFLTLSKIIDARDPFVSGHAAKVSDYATAIAAELHLPAERMEPLRQAGLLHDIGKIGISEQVLHKPDRLTTEEYSYVQGHAALGGEFLETCRSLRHLAPFVRHHHEWWDGTGYPDGLKGEEIPLESRILAVCDAVEAMASDRPYRSGMSLNKIINEINRCAGAQFDPAVAAAFVRIAEREREHLVTNSALEVLLKQTEADLSKEERTEGAPYPLPAMAS